MTEEQKIYLASKFADKGWDYETCKYGDDIYGNEELIDDVWNYVTECKEIGRTAFYIKYCKYNLY